MADALRAHETESTNAPQPKWLNVKDAARAAGVSVNTMREYIRSGQIGTVPVGTRQYVPVSELERFERESVERSHRAARS